MGAMQNFLDILFDKHKERYQKSITHPLTEEICQGVLPDVKLFTYLVQDLKYFRLGLNAFGKTLTLCDNEKSAIILGKQIGFICNDENDYFEITLKDIKSKSKEELESKCAFMLNQEPTLPEVQAYLDYLNYIVHDCTSYVEVATFMYMMEKIYLDWAEPHSSKSHCDKLPFKYSEWIRLHSGKKFSNWVCFLRNEVERSVISDEDRAVCEKTFLKTLELEIDFFEACYVYKE
ncbi:Piso0_000013 [Millerozyma farinosa CBS 7064]|uniref:Piso0_000013 protein n=1 Tax=Pichia sorbitophila (strain ATCC MYA-4447 / BCRC 22081 / CBS 7064 / NBRC 10061 / NRRL Y-12695) TaxID=559304 RepID=G8YUB2_PICSO|nr:Piso0_000013 [Millerozyma farinosa CBS 7064]